MHLSTGPWPLFNGVVEASQTKNKEKERKEKRSL
jgi:hypothetical protein